MRIPSPSSGRNPLTYRAAEFAFQLGHLRVRAVLVTAGSTGEIVDIARRHGSAVIDFWRWHA